MIIGTGLLSQIPFLVSLFLWSLRIWGRDISNSPHVIVHTPIYESGKRSTSTTMGGWRPDTTRNNSLCQLYA
jgi:hypothetical protein